jgi:hypothetical protein
MPNAYWTFYRQIAKILKDGKVKFDEPRGKVRFISDAWKKEKKRINSLNADADSKETLEAVFIAKKADEKVVDATAARIQAEKHLYEMQEIAKAEKVKAIEALAKVVEARAARLQAEKYLYEMQEIAKIALADAAEVIEKWEKMKVAVK